MSESFQLPNMLHALGVIRFPTTLIASCSWNFGITEDGSPYSLLEYSPDAQLPYDKFTYVNALAGYSFVRTPVLYFAQQLEPAAVAAQGPTSIVVSSQALAPDFKIAIGALFVAVRNGGTVAPNALYAILALRAAPAGEP